MFFLFSHLKQFDYLSYTFMLFLGYEVPTPKQVTGFRQLTLPFQSLVWIALGMLFTN